MKRRLRAILCITLSLVLSLSTFCSVSAQTISDKEIAMKKLNKLGLSNEKILATFPEKDLIAIGSANSIATTKKFFRVDKNDGNVEEISEIECNKNVKEIKEKESLNRKKIENAIKEKLSVPSATNMNIEGVMSISNSSDTQTTSDGYFTSTLYLLDCISDYLVIYDCEWLTVPFNRGIDAFGIITQNLALNSVSECYYSADYTNYDNTLTSGTSFIYPSVKRSGNGAGAEIDLFMNTFSTSTLRGKMYNNHRAYISMRSSNSNFSNTYVSAWGEYYHQEVAVQVSPGLSIGSTSLSFSLGFTMNEMLPNPYCIDNR